MCQTPQGWQAFVVGALLVTAIFGCGAGRGSPPPTADESQAVRHPALRLQFTRDDAGSATGVEILGLSPDQLAAFQLLSPAARADVLSVYVGDQEADEQPAMLGKLSVAGEALRFTPRFTLARGMKYRIVVDVFRLAGGQSSASADKVTLRFQTEPAPAAAPTEVAHIYPTRDRLPENQLKFYLHFSAPMSRGDAYRHVHLLDDQGHEMEDVFLELGEELWDPELRRFTLLCDPARVKRGLVPREELGPVLEADRDYTLLVDRDWPDAQGQPLAATARKSFHVLPPDEEPIDPTAWHLEPPTAGTREPLVMRLGEPLDHALLQRAIAVTDAKNSRVDGKIEVTDEETAWRFSPNDVWQAGTYALVIDTILEDLAGNAVGRAFDVDTFGPIQNRIDTETVSLPFEIKASP